MQICIIGAGMAGICAAKYSLQNNIKPIVFEQTDDIGGTWVYTDNTGLDKYGLPVHSSMYKNLRTNLPKEIMGFPDFPMPEQEKSYIPAEDVLEFLVKYVDNFKIRNFIKFRHHVEKVQPTGDSKWQVVVKDLVKNEVITYLFDFIIVCNGHYHTPRVPYFTGMDIYRGRKIHSHEFRRCEDYKDDSILIIGAGPSGRDLANELSNFSKKITISHHSAQKLNLPECICQKPDIYQLTENGVEFKDGTFDKFSLIIYCTGYQYSFPFLTSDCNIHVDDNYVQSLYKQCININHPTMALIGLPFKSQISQMVDLQIRFVMEYFTGRKELPTKDEMLKTTETEMQERWLKGWKKRHAHMLGVDFRNKYYSDLAVTAGIEKIKPVMEKLILESNYKLAVNIANFRRDIYRIVDDENFVQINE